MKTNEKFDSLKEITDRFIGILHDLYGGYIDSQQAFTLYAKHWEKQVQQHNLPGEHLITSSNSNPDDPDALILHSVTLSDLIARNSEGGDNINKVQKYLIAMLLEHWDNDIRKKIASVLGFKETNDVKSDIMKDINKIRQDILHSRGKADRSASNKIIVFPKGSPIKLSESIMMKIFTEIFEWLNNLFVEHTEQKAYADNSLNLKQKDWHRSMTHTIVSSELAKNDTISRRE